MSFASYGIWEVEAQTMFGTSYVGAAFSFGVLTSAGAMPATGAAVYNGTLRGLFTPAPVAGQLFNSQSTLAGTATVAADFAAGTVSADFTGITASPLFGPFTPRNPNGLSPVPVGPAGAFVSIHGDGAIAGNGFAGPAFTVAPTGAVLSPNITGEMNGNFFGTAGVQAASEVGGVIRLGDPGGAQVVGGFAARNPAVPAP
jgi:hypothetical protein